VTIAVGFHLFSYRTQKLIIDHNIGYCVPDSGFSNFYLARQSLI